MCGWVISVSVWVCVGGVDKCVRVWVGGVDKCEGVCVWGWVISV